jgi:hypothetical protein
MFFLYYKNILIGTLDYKDEFWLFNYSYEFKNQNKILPLINFPSLNKNYISKELWPFFKCRLPGDNNPLIKNKLQDREEFSQYTMLVHYGKHTIANPFILTHESKKK